MKRNLITSKLIKATPYYPNFLAVRLPPISARHPSSSLQPEITTLQFFLPYLFTLCESFPDTLRSLKPELQENDE